MPEGRRKQKRKRANKPKFYKRHFLKQHEVIDLQIILNKKPKNPILIHGFPGIGLVGTIATEFLLDHLKTEQIGKITVEEMPPMVAIHEGKMVDPFGIFYNKQHNIVILHAVAPTQGFEWKLAQFIAEAAKRLQAKEIVSIEGVAGKDPEEFKTFFYTNDKRKEQKLQKSGIEKMKEGIIMGVTGSVLLKSSDKPLTCIFSETHTQLPDSKAAAKIIEGLDRYLGLRVDYAPLLKQAENFEEKLQGLLKKGAETADLSEKKRMSYVG
ncbi:hypothetical protein GF323_02075 [Candidatus Woesearchaeota archaeon]|nr:hypothetical protein [Candidatus Woesearchaeota archaeon]